MSPTQSTFVLLLAASAAALRLPGPRMAASREAAASTGALRTFADLSPAEGNKLVKSWRADAAFQKADTATLGLISDADGAASTISLVEAKRGVWSVVALCVKAAEAGEDGPIIEAEAATLNELFARASAAESYLRVHSSVEAALTGSRRCLGLTRPPPGFDGAGGTAWFHCGPEKAEEAECELVEGGEAEECLIVSPSGSGDCMWTAEDEATRIDRRFEKASKGGLAGGGAYRGDAR